MSYIPKHTPEEILSFLNNKEEMDSVYRDSCFKQLEEWINGNNYHNHFKLYMGVEDPDGNIIDYIEIKDGECCPDFSCCTEDETKHWTKEMRMYFYNTYITKGPDACIPLLFGGIYNILPEELNTYISGQVPNKDNIH